jgi:NAD(P) transhydrogenase subunit alpha
MTSDGEVTPDFSDEIVEGTCVTHDGVVRNEAARRLLGEDG